MTLPDHKADKEDLVMQCKLLIGEMSRALENQPPKSHTFEHLVELITQELEKVSEMKARLNAHDDEDSNILKKQLNQLSEIVVKYSAQLIGGEANLSALKAASQEAPKGLILIFMIYSHYYIRCIGKSADDYAILKRELEKEKRKLAGMELSIEALTEELDAEKSESDRLRNQIESLEYDLMLDRATIVELKAALPPTPPEKNMSTGKPFEDIQREYGLLSCM